MASGIAATGKFLLTLGFASALVLVFSLILPYFYPIMKLGTVRDIIMFLFPTGLLLIIFFVAVAVYYKEIQETKS